MTKVKLQNFCLLASLTGSNHGCLAAGHFIMQLTILYHDSFVFLSFFPTFIGFSTFKCNFAGWPSELGVGLKKKVNQHSRALLLQALLNSDPASVMLLLHFFSIPHLLLCSSTLERLRHQPEPTSVWLLYVTTDLILAILISI